MPEKLMVVHLGAFWGPWTGLEAASRPANEVIP